MIQDFQMIGDNLAVRWNDGRETFVSWEKLRRACPCAGCGGEPDVLGRVQRPEVSYAPDSFRLASIAPVGGYALLPRWADGHSTGIYSFVYLRNLGE